MSIRPPTGSLDRAFERKYFLCYRGTCVVAESILRNLGLFENVYIAINDERTSDEEFIPVINKFSSSNYLTVHLR
jgi:hypothetical protein